MIIHKYNHTLTAGPSGAAHQLRGGVNDQSTTWAKHETAHSLLYWVELIKAYAEKCNASYFVENETADKLVAVF